MTILFRQCSCEEPARRQPATRRLLLSQSTSYGGAGIRSSSAFRDFLRRFTSNIFLKRLTTCLFARVTSLFASTKVWCQFGINDGDKHENGDDGAINMPAKTAMAVFLQSSSSTAKTPPRNTETTLLIGTRNKLGEDLKNLGRQTGDAKRPSLLAQRHIRILLLIEGLFSVGVCTDIHLQSGGRFCVPGVGRRNGTASLAGREWRQEPSWFACVSEK